MKVKPMFTAACLCLLVACSKTFDEQASVSAGESSNLIVAGEDAANFSQIASIDLGDAGAAEISAYDPLTKKLFVVNNGPTNKIDVVDLSNPSAPTLIASIDLAAYGGLVNSLAATRGLLAAAIEASDKVQPGKVVVFSAVDYAEIKQVPVGSLPDMVAASSDGSYIVTANEGEPNSYNEPGSVDPVGSVSIISVRNNFAVTTLDFSAFAGQADDLKKKGFRIFGPNASFAQDVEPEYVTISDDAKTAWVTLQENNGIAKVDLEAKAITDIFPLGFKNFNRLRNAFDPSDRNTVFTPGTWPVKGIYQPDGISVINMGGTPLLCTVNEGDARDYDGFAEEIRVKDGAYPLDPLAFPNAADLKTDGKLGRLTVTNTMGDTDNDGDYDEIYTFGARSFTLWNGNTGNIVYDCGSELEQATATAGFYPTDRSDNKGVEPEGIAGGYVDGSALLFIGMERANACAIYTLNSQLKPQISQVLETGEAPEGILFVPRLKSPDNRSLLIVSSENDGVVTIYAPSAK